MQVKNNSKASNIFDKEILLARNNQTRKTTKKNCIMIKSLLQQFDRSNNWITYEVGEIPKDIYQFNFYFIFRTVIIYTRFFDFIFACKKCADRKRGGIQ